ncbi:MAG: glycosyltransferase, partial [Bacteroidetes bacterium]|nr:glycosyltransferase [Bacteroidota bacterium]
MHDTTDSDLPVASVVTTVYNREHTLARAMASVLTQSFTDFEYIIVDDGSTDASVHIAGSSGDPRVRLLRETHRGRPAALNTAFSHCRGRYILIQDSDDIALPERFSEQISYLEQHPETGLLGCDVLLTDPAETSRRILRMPREHDDIRHLMPLTNAVVFGACCIRVAHIPDTLRFDESMPAAEDFDFQLRLLRVTRFHNLPLLLLHIIETPDSLSRRPDG